VLKHPKEAIKQMEEHLLPWFTRMGYDSSYFWGLEPSEKELLHDFIYHKINIPEGIRLEKIAFKLRILGEEARSEGTHHKQHHSKKELLELFVPSDEEDLKKF
jgi:hypothetical protein